MEAVDQAQREHAAESRDSLDEPREPPTQRP